MKRHTHSRHTPTHTQAHLLTMRLCETNARLIAACYCCWSCCCSCSCCCCLFVCLCLLHNNNSVIINALTALCASARVCIHACVYCACLCVAVLYAKLIKYVYLSKFNCIQQMPNNILRKSCSHFNESQIKYVK